MRRAGRHSRRFHSKPVGWFVVALLSAVFGCSSEGDPRPVGTLDDLLALRERNDLNVLFILIDTLRADRLGVYGSERATSPTIDALAASGIRFKNQLSQSSWTKCSMASLWTGLYPNRVGVLRAAHALPEAAILPAEIFRDAGFRTTGIYRNGWVAENFGFAQGFEIYMIPGPSKSERDQAAADPAAIAGDDGDVVRAATGFLRNHAPEQWFLYLHLLDAHQYVSDPESSVFGTSYSDIYDNAILWTDGLIGHLLAELDALGLRERTLIVLASDHGEAFGEHNKDGHAFDVYGEVTEVPFILSLPFRLDPGAVVSQPTENIDVWPTVFDLLGMPPLEDPDGVSRVSLIEAAVLGDSPANDETPRIAHLEQSWAHLEADESAPIVSVSEDRWRLIYQGTRAPLELYEKQVDPREQHNLATEHPDVATSLRETAESYLLQSTAPWPEDPLLIEIDDMELNQLRALGYGVQ